MKAITGALTLAALATALTASPAAADNACGNRLDLAKGPTLTVLGLTADGRLLRFGECNPDAAREIGTVLGLSGSDTALVGMDYRVQDGLLYGVGNGGGIYTINTRTARATLVSQLTGGIALDGTVFCVDFNPAANRLRIMSNTGQNLRHNVEAGGVTIEDADLNYPPDPPPAPGITGCAYTNNDLDPDTGTTLYDIDTVRNQVALQSPPNNGTLVPVGKLFDASLPVVDPSSPAGFDIHTRLRDGAAVFNSGFASLVVGGVTGFYRLNFLTGQATLIGVFDDSVIDIAIPLAQ
jgi:hypothetical protein